jgi:phenylacetate-CoA ligase
MSVVSTSHQLDPFVAARSAFVDGLPDHFQRLAWTPDQVRSHQASALRGVLRVAVERSPFHARRLARLVGDVDRFELDDLHRLPVMTKAEMMADYDDVPTDRRLTRAAVNAFIETAGDEPRALFDEYLVLASGGSSGLRGVFAMHLDFVPDYLCGILRGGLARAGDGGIPTGLRVAMVAAGSSVHSTRAIPTLIHGTLGKVSYAPATLPLAEITARLQIADPTLLVGYPSALSRVADEQLAGRLNIHPVMVLSGSELLTSETSTKLAAAFGVPPGNAFGSSEGLNGAAGPGDDVFTFASDLAHVEFVDADDRPVPIGEPADHVLVTNLLNKTQPLIRYRLDDRMTPQPPLPCCGHVRATLEGRTDPVLQVGGREVHPHALRSVLVRASEVTEYQVRVGRNTLSVDVIAHGPVDTDRLAADLTTAMANVTSGGPTPDVTVTVVDELQRDRRSGKLSRFLVVP